MYVIYLIAKIILQYCGASEIKYNIWLLLSVICSELKNNENENCKCILWSLTATFTSFFCEEGFLSYMYIIDNQLFFSLKHFSIKALPINGIIKRFIKRRKHLVI